MDRITSSMCEKAFGRATFARVLVEVDAAKGLPDSIEVCYKSLGKSMCLGVEYAWSPPVCSHCKVFWHNIDVCTKRELTEAEKSKKSKKNEVNVQNVPRAGKSVNTNEDWKTVSYKKGVSNVAENSQDQGYQYSNRGPYNTRSNAVKGRGNFSGRGGYRNVMQGESSKTATAKNEPVVHKSNEESDGFQVAAKKNKAVHKENEPKKNTEKQEILTKNRYSTLINADENVTMVDDQDLSNSSGTDKSYGGNSESIKGKIFELEKEIMESNRSIGSTANKKAKEKDSHSHLFFDFIYSRRLWERLKAMAKLDDINYTWGEVISGIERNFRVFQKCSRSEDCLFSIIIETIRLRLMGLQILKVSADVKEASLIWNFPLRIGTDDSR
ncbi:hypothetical protein CTI12_AA427380 [Artemisia annua]|uniref:Zinc knuckle CX2CX4HX4C n=1 Tax=Artemisia annua TaxID=35608 RepID=A0A2U1M281_ARTAN|nr:hypothetical protein CTI12_AA427380 [Artemisia annua]